MRLWCGESVMLSVLLLRSADKVRGANGWVTSERGEQRRLESGELRVPATVWRACWPTAGVTDCWWRWR
nr:hypothetical protein Itr_chr13CG19580 [Ipomoea trifida]